ncbi:hypothetical protein PCASD_17837 [Puccinia coronata f. sp. avenae]|uniref:Uncharacterized protein n=1 Tax=Puccinia coronata f. sp. avenae TaxID=200324 RepID=A0A2N5TTL5_9BASI|nr:hypothetical protein PCASD_17837 [Puccinia coronata f. sp. avenae]
MQAHTTSPGSPSNSDESMTAADATPTSDAPSDCSSNEDERPGQIVDVLDDLHAIWSTEIRDLRERVETPEVLSADKLAERKALLVKIQTELMPSLKQQITALLVSLGLNASVTHPEPNLDETLELVSNLGPALDDLHNSIIGLAPWYIPGPDNKRTTHSHIDQNYGVLKKFRCDQLNQLFRLLANFIISPLIDAYSRYLDDWLHLPDSQGAEETRADITEATENCHKAIDYWLELSTRSDYGFLQDGWVTEEERLNTSIAKSRKQFRKAAGRERPDQSPTQAGLVISHLSSLFRDTVTIGGLLRMALQALVGTSRFPSIITFPDDLSSNELEWVLWDSRVLIASFITAVDSLTAVLRQCLGFSSDPPHRNLESEQLNTDMYHTYRGLARVHSRLDSLLALISIHHIPSEAGSRFPPSINLFRSMFLQMRTQFIAPMREFRHTFENLQLDLRVRIPMI